MACCSQGKRVLISVNGHPTAMHAFNWYFENMHQPTNHVLVCHIPSSLDFPALSLKDGLAVPAGEWQKKMQKKIEGVEQIRKNFEFELVNRKATYTFVATNSGNAGKGIIKYAEDERADMIVLGNRGPSRHGLLGRGSTSGYVVSHAPIPVVVVPMSSSATSL